MRKHENWSFTKLYLCSIVSNVDANEYQILNPRPSNRFSFFNCIAFRECNSDAWIFATSLRSYLRFNFPQYLGATHSPCIVSLPVITCQLQAPSRRLTAIRGNSSQYDVARIFIDWCCFLLARIRREIIARKIERKRVNNFAFTQKYRRLIRRVLAYVPVRQHLLRETPRDLSIIPLRRLYRGQS